MLQHLERRDRTALLLYLISGAVIVVVGEAGAFYLGMAERYGFMPLLLRGIVYLLLTMHAVGGLAAIQPAHGDWPDAGKPPEL